MLFGRACEPVRNLPCWHDLLWQAMEDGCRNVVLGPWSGDGTRHIEPLPADISPGLAAAADDSLMLSHIAPAAVWMIDAAGSPSCLNVRAKELRNNLLDVCARAACHWADKHYDWRTEQRAAFASALLRWASYDGAQVIIEYAGKLRSSIAALSAYLQSLIIVATHETDFVSHLAEAWPQLMGMGLAVIREHAPGGTMRAEEQLLSELVPAPSAFGYPDDLDAVLANARSGWFPLQAVTQHIEEWLELAQGEMSAVDAMVGFLETQTVQHQLQPGLDWVRKLVVTDDGTASTSGFLLVRWLSTLRESAALDTALRHTYRVIVDALVLSDYRGARDLQRLDE